MTDRQARRTDRTEDPLLKYVHDNSLRLLPVQQKLREVTDQHEKSIMLGSPVQLQLLQNMVRSINGKKTLDIGVYTGYSAMTIALALPEDGTVVACDVNDDYANIGKPFWKEAGVLDKISLRIAPAKDTLDKLIAAGESGSYDFAFIDADKSSYDTYYEQCLQLIRPGGIIALDNMLWDARVADPQVTDITTEAIRKMNSKLHTDSRVFISLLPVGDGTMLAFKK